MRIQCLITRSFLKRFAYGDLGKRLGGYIQSHIDHCDECREREGWLLQLSYGLRTLEAPPVDEREWEAIWNAISDEIDDGYGVPGTSPTNESQTAHAPWRYALLVAAVALLVAGAALRIVLSGNQSQQTPIASYIQYHEDAVDGHVLLENHFWSAQILPVSYTAGK
jgi:hypothetical protein